MDPSILGLEITCIYFKQFEDINIKKLRRQLNTSHVRNHRLNNRIRQLELEINRLKISKQIYESIVVLITRLGDLEMDTGVN